MDEKKKKVVLGSVAGVALVAAAVMMVVNLMPSSPKVELTTDQQQAAIETNHELEKALDVAAEQVEAEKVPEPDPATDPMEHKMGRMFKPKK